MAPYVNESPDPWKDYHRVKVVGRGAHGVAILCRRRRDASMVVVKEVYQEEEGASEAPKKTTAPTTGKTGTTTTTTAGREDRRISDSMNEIRLLSMLRHDNILGYYDSFRAVASAEGGMERRRSSIGAGSEEILAKDEEVEKSSAGAGAEDASGESSNGGMNENGMDDTMAKSGGSTAEFDLVTTADLAKLMMRNAEDAEGDEEEEIGEKGGESITKSNAGRRGAQETQVKARNGNVQNNALALMIVMEYADGGTLEDYLKLQFAKGIVLEEKEVLNLFCQIALALHHIHACNILHRDLKTTNILISGSGPNKVLKIGDFGISKQLGSKSKAETVVGTPSYISPELCQGKPYDHKSDVWALGCILYEVAMMKRLFEASNLLALVLKIVRGSYDPLSDRYSRELETLLASLIELDPCRRPDMTSIVSEPFLQRHFADVQMRIGRVDPSVFRGRKPTTMGMGTGTGTGTGIGTGREGYSSEED